MSLLSNLTVRLRRLSPGSLGITERASQLLVSRRKVYRDIDFLDEHGAPQWEVERRIDLNRARYLAESTRLIMRQ